MPEKTWPRLVLVALGLCAVLVALWLTIGNAWVARQERQEEQAWTETFGSIEALQRKYPPAPGNETARKAEQAAQALVGLDLAPHVGLWSTQANLEPETRKMLFDIGERLNPTLSGPTSAIPAAPDTFVAFLTARRAGLDELENLLAAEGPRWRFDASGADKADHAYPNLLGQIKLQKLLVSDALESFRKGDRGSALRALEASWSLNSSLLGRPELISQLIAIAVVRFQAGALRKIDVGASPWRARMAGVDPRARVFDALLLGRGEQSRRAAAARERGPFLPVGEWLKWSGNRLKEPIERWQNVEYLRSVRNECEDIRSAYVTDAIGVKKVSTMMYGPASSFERAERLVVDAELTERVLRAREAMAANRGVWPASIPGIEVARVQGAHWIYAVAPGGTASIALDRDLQPPEQAGVILPLRWTSG